jgi:UDP-N-acetylglucosamine enolpyruvyl transferase
MNWCVWVRNIQIDGKVCGGRRGVLNNLWRHRSWQPTCSASASLVIAGLVADGRNPLCDRIYHLRPWVRPDGSEVAQGQGAYIERAK